MSVDLWTEKYRPKTLDEYVWRNPRMRTKAEEWLAAGALPHLLFTGLPGTGKTSLAFLLLKVLEIPKADILYINASKERKVDDIQDRMAGFVSSWALGPSGIKYIILDEMDAVGKPSQKILRSDLEQFSDITRVIGTANYGNMIIEALHSRFTTLNFQILDRESFLSRVFEVLVNEGVDIDADVVDTYVQATYPDLRKCIGLVQHNTIGNKLYLPEDDNLGSREYILNMVQLFKEGKFLEARRLIVAQAQPEEYPEIFRTLYRNLSWFGATQKQQDDALLIIAKSVVDLPMVGDPEILLAACLVQLTTIANGD